MAPLQTKGSHMTEKRRPVDSQLSMGFNPRLCAHKTLPARSFYCEKCFDMAESLVNSKEIDKMWKRGSDALDILIQVQNSKTCT